MYLNGNSLIYVKDDCVKVDISEKFFLWLFPANLNDILAESRQYGIDNLGFFFYHNGFR